jgi:hypothetical protein
VKLFRLLFALSAPSCALSYCDSGASSGAARPNEPKKDEFATCETCKDEFSLELAMEYGSPDPKRWCSQHCAGTTLQQKLAAGAARIEELEKQLESEQQAHDEIGAILLPVVGTGDGTSVSAVSRLVARLEAVESANRELTAALRNLVEKLKDMERPLNACIAISEIHGKPYAGPDWVGEMVEAEALLRKG